MSREWIVFIWCTYYTVPTYPVPVPMYYVLSIPNIFSLEENFLEHARRKIVHS